MNEKEKSKTRKQFERLECEQLKEYFSKNFEEYRKKEAVIYELLRCKEEFVVRLHDSFPKSSEFTDLTVKGAYENELHKVFSERHSIREEIRKAGKNFANEKPLNIAQMKVDFLERKLDIIEEELNNRGVFVTMEDGEIVFEER